MQHDLATDLQPCTTQERLLLMILERLGRLEDDVRALRELEDVVKGLSQDPLLALRGDSHMHQIGADIRHLGKVTNIRHSLSDADLALFRERGFDVFEKVVDCKAYYMDLYSETDPEFEVTYEVHPQSSKPRDLLFCSYKLINPAQSC